jgi:hypothetical protein
MDLSTLFGRARLFPARSYFRSVGRHTRNFCKRAEARAKTPDQRRIWFLTAISADEAISALTGLETRRPLGAMADWPERPADRGRDPGKALRVYLSALLLLYGSCKEALLARFGMAEREFMETWQSVFEYGAADKHLFDAVLAPAFQGGNIDGLVMATGGLLQESLFTDARPFEEKACASLRALLMDDLSALTRFLAQPAVKA